MTNLAGTLMVKPRRAAQCNSNGRTECFYNA